MEMNVPNSGQMGGMRPPQSSGTESDLIRDLSFPLIEAKGWMKLLGVVMIVYGVIIALSIVGIIVAWLPIWLGVLLFKAAGYAETARMTGERLQLVEALRRIRTYFVINGVLLLIGLVVVAIIFIFGLGGMMWGLNNM